MKRRIAIITGVSRLKGIGRAICIELAKREFDIFFTYWTPYDRQIFTDIDPNEPDLIKKEILELGVNCQQLELDLSIPDAVNILLNNVNTSLGSPSVLVNNATYSTQTNLNTLTALELDKHYEINLKATTLLTAEFTNQFKFKSGGRIINLTSGQSLGPMANEIAYAITKGAIETLTTTLSHEMASKGITINAINPGPNDTGWMSGELKNHLLHKFPMNRIGLPEDTAKLVGFLASPEAEWITGQIIHSEGGFNRHI